MNTGHWSLIASEGDTVELSTQSTVRYGASSDAQFVEQTVSGLVDATNDFFGGDPAPDMRKGLWLLQVAAPPAPEPPPEPPAPEPPSLDDPRFADKMRRLEFQQRERGMAATVRLAQANEAAAARYGDVILEFGRLLAFLRGGS